LSVGYNGSDFSKEALVKVLARIVIVLAAAGMMFSEEPKQKEVPAVSVVGYLRDSGCVHRYPEFVKPAPNGCVEACVRAGSPLVLLTKDGQIYHPISADIPDTDVRAKMMPFAGKLVKVTGHVYERGGSKAIALEQIEEQKE
jgi:hypothetical protein